MTESFNSSSFWSATQFLPSGSMGRLVVSLFVMSVMLFKLDSHGFDDSWLAKLRDSFDVTLHMEVSEWNLLIPRELRGSTQTVSSPCVGRFDFDI